jgi:hypothetical protein
MANSEVQLTQPIAPGAVATKSDDGLISFCLMLLRFYVVIAVVLLSVTAIEMYFGIHSGFATPEGILNSIAAAAM